MAQTLAMAVLSLFMVACASVSTVDRQTGERPALNTTEAGLWMQMDRVEERLNTSGRVIEDEKIDEYLRQVICRLAPAHCEGIRIYVVDVPFFNASMSPNGMMQVWTGLLLRTENEAQLAFVLGHELAHYTERHSLKRWIDLQNKANAATIFSMLSSAAGVGYAGYVGELAAIASVLSFSREQEREADELGTASVVAAGYDPREASRIWRALREEQAASTNDGGWIFLATHPGIDERIKSFQAAAGSATRGVTGESELVGLLAAYQDEWLGDELTRGEYDESEVLFRRLLKRDRNPGLIHFYLGELYRKRGQKGDLDLAIGEYRSALHQPDAPARTHRSLGQVLIRTGRTAEARSALEKYLEAAPTAPDRQIIQHQIDRLR
jgi:predicted Zn-dependent protease